ncbi:hypothetical protein BVG16_11240 [Paenibacillus selenitireducens]|uniref:SAM-dependent methyltransferase n=1 Tax=Paenibacillus selenitireducens TaxID=1324314 RepID=A0A1T2XEX6_9BACL|nr:SAM-dependent methyltransferase [Paenibacillus selenitireducens]OPA78444.1 hypothetical protein BVG16_11240 [Paenibacillus selenitireducens]
MSHYLGSDSLIQYIREEIQASPQGMISFQAYMESCLYHPLYGYYMNERPKIGKEGDFYTSAGIGSIMGDMLAAYIVRMIEQEGYEAKVKDGSMIRIVEWGAGTGQLGIQILEALERNWPDHTEVITYTIVEQSEYHRLRAQQNFNVAGKYAEWWTPEQFEVHAHATPVILLANELLDAFPVDRIRLHARDSVEKFEQQYITWNEEKNTFESVWCPAQKDLATYVHQYIVNSGVAVAPNQQLEINREGQKWLAQVTGAMGHGLVIVIDYGDVAEELMGAHRMLGTLVCYHRHQAHDNPLLHVGEQDITSHVDFSLLRRNGEGHGLETMFYGTQKQFLMEAGVLEQLQDHFTTDPFDAVSRRNRAIRQLLLSDQMSELFKVWVARKER